MLKGKRLVNAFCTDPKRLGFTIAVQGHIEYVFHGDFALPDQSVKFDEANPGKFYLRFVPAKAVRCLIAEEHPQVSYSKRP